MGDVSKSIFINAPYEKVYAFCRNPMTWSHWYANLLGPDKVTGDGSVGTTVEMRYTMLGIHVPITITVMEDTMYYRRFKLSGAIKGDQAVDYVPSSDGTEVVITTTYSIPSSVLEKIAETKIIEKLVENALIHTLKNLKAICEGME